MVPEHKRAEYDLRPGQSLALRSLGCVLELPDTILELPFLSLESLEFLMMSWLAPQLSRTSLPVDCGPRRNILILDGLRKRLPDTSAARRPRGNYWKLVILASTVPESSGPQGNQLAAPLERSYSPTWLSEK